MNKNKNHNCCSFNTKLFSGLVLLIAVFLLANITISWQTIGAVKKKIAVAIAARPKLILLTDKSCTECYPVSIHEKILSGFNFVPQDKDKKTVDYQSTEGKKLIAKYQIKLIPTIILGGDISAYPKLQQVWQQVGTVEKDGAYVFRDGVQQMNFYGAYRDLTTGQIIPKKQPPQTPVTTQSQTQKASS